MKKRLLMISGLGGVEALVSGKQGAFYNTLEEFHAYWERIDIISPKVKGQKHGTRVLFDNVHVHISPWPLIFHPAFFIKKGIELWKRYQFDLMTVHEFPPFYNGIGARILHSITGVPYVLEVMHIPGVPRAGGFKEMFYKWLMRLFISSDVSAARAVRIINRKQAKEFLIKAGVPSERLRYIPAFYIDLEVFRPMETEKKYDLVYAARLERNKGIHLLLEAVKFSIYNSQFPIKLLIIGNGPLKPKLQKYIKENGLENNVFFSGWLTTSEDVARAYSSAKIFVNPSLNEGGPRVALEAMACGIPVITTRVGLMLDIIEDGKNGIFTDWEPDRMAQAIKRMLDDGELQRKCAENGIKTVQQFEKKSAVKDYADDLQSLAS